MRVIIIIQARTSSSRLPRKVERRVGEHRLIDWVLKYCTESSADDVVLAVPGHQVNDLSAMVAEQKSVHIFGGSEDNVASRFAEAGVQHKADYVIRVTCDDPFKPVELIKAALEAVDRALELRPGGELEAYREALTKLVDAAN